MKDEYLDLPEGNELDLLKEQLDESDIFIISFLKGFNRKNMREWSEMGLWDFSINYQSI